MSELVEATHVTLGGEVGTNDWALPYLDEQHSRSNMKLLMEADALLLGGQTYEHLSVAYTRMAEHAPANVPMDFIDRMNSIPKHVATTTPPRADLERDRDRRRCRLIRRRSQAQRRPEPPEIWKRAARHHA